jgi:hypothetical protein
MLFYLILCYEVLFYVVSFYFIVFYCILFILGYLWLLPKEGSRREPPRWQRHTLIRFDLILVEIIYLGFLPGEGPWWPPPWQGHAFIFLLRSILFVYFLFYSNVSAPKGKPRRPPGRQRCALIWFDLILVWFSLVWFNLVCFSLVWFNLIYYFIFL